MSERVQECPICGARQPLASRVCSICGAVLPGERTPLVMMPPVEARKPDKRDRPRYDPTVGDDDLFAGDLSGRMWRLLLVGGIVLALVLGVGIGIVIGRMEDEGSGLAGAGPTAQMDDDAMPGDPAQGVPTLDMGQAAGTPFATMPPTGTPREAFVTSSPAIDPFLDMPTVTPLPPSPTSTPTPGPCYQTAKPGDTVLGLALVCGHRDMDVIPLILEINGMESANALQEGQTLEIPWPTPTGGPPTTQPSPDPNAGAGGAGMGAANTPEVQVNEFGMPDALVYYQNIEPTLRPGLAWHQIQAGETIVGIAYQYETNVETLSQINPEISFLQCDYGMTYGGQNCAVMLYEGQRLRVPVAIPTVTPTATPDGTFTPTPTPTATFNAPYPLTPDDGARFMADQMVTLRWGGTGTLGPDERYVVRVEDMEEGTLHTALVMEASYTLPGGWQPDDGERHTFNWTVAVGVVNDQNVIVAEQFQTAPRFFIWDSR